MFDKRPSSSQEKQISVLYVDDEADLLFIGKAFLERVGGFRVDTKTSALEALNSSQIRTYDAVVSDFQMPEMDGIAFLKAFRKDFGDVPFILFTGRGREEVIIESINNGADFYLQKGGNPQTQFAELSHKIKQAVRRRQAEIALIESESRLRSFFETTSESVSLMDEEGKVVEWNPVSEQISGISKEEALGSYVWDLTIRMVPPKKRTEEHREHIRQAILTSLNTGIPMFKGPRTIETERPDGHKFFCRQVAFPIKTNRGFRFGSISQDITEEKQAEEALRESENRYRAMAERSSDLILILDKRMCPTYVSPSARSILGYEPEELIGISYEYVADTIFKPCETGFLDSVYTSMRGESVDNRELCIARKDGTRIFVNICAIPIIQDGIVSGAQVSMRDVTTVKTAVRELMESEEKFRRFALNARDLLFRISLPDQRYEFISPASATLTGYTPEEFYADPTLMESLVHPAWRDYFCSQWDAILKTNPVNTLEYQIIDRTGNTRWFNQRNKLVTDDHGQPVALEGSITDVSNQKKTEEELLSCEQRFNAATLNAGFWIWEIDSEGIFRYASPAVEDILGYRPDELVGKFHRSGLFDPSVRKELEAEAANLFGSHESFRYFVNLNRHRNGVRVLLKTSGTPVFDKNGIFAGYCGVDEDISKENKDTT